MVQVRELREQTNLEQRLNQVIKIASNMIRGITRIKMVNQRKEDLSFEQ